MQPTNPDPATMSPQDAQKAVATDLTTYAGGGPDAAAAKERIINIMAAQMKISHDDAAKKFDDAQAKLQQTRDKAIQTAKDAADASASAASKASFGAFLVVLLGGLAAAFGGSHGRSAPLSGLPTHREYRPHLTPPVNIQGILKMESEVRELLCEELKDAYSAEKQALRCMQKTLKMASAPALREGIQLHIEQTQVQIERVEQAMEKLEIRPGRKVCEAMRGLVEEATARDRRAGRQGSDPGPGHRRQHAADRALRDRCLRDRYRPGRSTGRKRGGRTAVADA